jgi:hypothetical protein
LVFTVKFLQCVEIDTLSDIRHQRFVFPRSQIYNDLHAGATQQD